MLLGLDRSLNRHPRDVVLPFFKRISEDSYRRGFQEAVAGFVERIEKRAVDKRKEMDAEAPRTAPGDDGGFSTVKGFLSFERGSQTGLEALEWTIEKSSAGKPRDLCSSAFELSIGAK